MVGCVLCRLRTTERSETCAWTLGLWRDGVDDSGCQGGIDKQGKEGDDEGSWNAEPGLKLRCQHSNGNPIQQEIQLPHARPGAGPLDGYRLGNTNQ